MELKGSKIGIVVLSALCSVLIILHGIEGIVTFKVDVVSILLLLIAFLPFYGLYFDKVKSGNFEIYFHSLPLSDQVLTLIRSISKDSTWTFYSPRDGEKGFGDGVKIFVEELLERDFEKMVSELKKWLRSGNSGEKWMASEIIGYFVAKHPGLGDIKGYLPPLYKHKNMNDPWAEYQLNCCWAHSKIDNNFKEIHNLLLRTTNEFNQNWLLDVYHQMPKENHGDVKEFAEVLRKYLERTDIVDVNRAKAIKILQTISPA